MSIEGSESLGSASEVDVDIIGRFRCTLGCGRGLSVPSDDDGAVGGTTVLSEARSLVVDEEVTELDAVVSAL